MSAGGRYDDEMGCGRYDDGGSDNDDLGGYDSDGYRPRPDRNHEDMLDYHGDEFSAGFRAPRIAPQWRFLRGFIGFLEGHFWLQAPNRLHSDNVRLGRDVDDWWINVLHENDFDVSRYGELDADSVRHAVRDATLLLGVLARVDYDAFLALLMRRGKFGVSRYMDLKHHELPRQFNFPFSGNLEPSDLTWKNVRHVFGDKYNSGLISQLVAIEEIATASTGNSEAPSACIRALRERLYAPIKVKLTFRPEVTSIRDQVQIIRNITKIVVEMQQIEARHAHAVAAGTAVAPAYHLDHIDLDLRAFCAYSDVFKALETLLKTGVRVASLTLPQPIEEEQWNTPIIHLAWASFVVVALGARPSKRPVVIDHLVLPRLYTYDIFMTAFLSALRYTTVLKSLRIEADREPDNCAIRTNDRQHRIWAGLAYALFNVSSSHTVECLDLSGHRLTDEALAEFSRMMMATDPNLDWLYSKGRAIPAQPSMQVNYPLGMIMRGTSIQLFACAERCDPLRLPTSFLGEIMMTDPTDPWFYMLVPGFGFAKAPKECVRLVRGCRPRMMPPKRVTKLVFNVKLTRQVATRQGVGPAFVTRPYLPRLLQIVGGSLTSLALHADDLDDACIQSAIRSCPKLENLLIDSTSVQSLSHLISAYEQGVRGQPTSLDLRNVSIPKEAIEGFIERLGSYGHPLHRRLRRLSIGQGWTRLLGASTAERLDAMLANNRVLSHLYVDGGRELPWHPDNNQQNRERITGTPFPTSSRLAVVGVLRQYAASGRVPAAGQLSEHVLRSVFEFAGEVSYRVAAREFGIHYGDEEWWDW